MSDRVIIAASFIAVLSAFAAIGIYSARRHKNTTTDYLLASRQVPAWLTGLSAFATAHSGGMFISMVGWTYQTGISSMWLLVGWFLGDYLSWFVIHRQLREQSEAAQIDTFGAFLGISSHPGDAGDRPNRMVVSVAAIVTLAFLGAYAASQLLAGSKALYAVFGLDYVIGIVLAAAIVVAYCFSGGIRASIWTDAAQSIVMLGSMGLLVTIATIDCGGFSGLWSQLAAIDPALVSVVPQDLKFGFGLFLLSWLAGGVGAIGQPHIMVRAMALDRPQDMGQSRNLYAGLYVLFASGAILVGLAARVLVPGLLDGGDPELALPTMAVALMPAALVGMILAGIFAAVVSTADSQILSCSASLSQDLLPQQSNSYRRAKVSTLVVTVLVVAIALSSNKNMFALGVFAWSALSCSLGPVLAVRVWKLPLAPGVAIAMMVGGIGMATVWNWVLGWSASVYEVLPGMAAAVAIYAIAQPLSSALK